MACQGVRRLSLKQKQLLTNVWALIKPMMQSNSDGKYSEILSWCNFYENKKFKVKNPIMDQWLNWTQKLVHQVYPENHILCSGFVRNPPRSKKNQTWHLDYGRTNIIMIPLVNQTLETATQLIQSTIRQKGQKSPLGYDTHFGESIFELMEREQRDFLKVSQIVCKSFTVLKVNQGTVHRGIANNSDQERVLFTVNCSPTYFELNQQPLVISNFKQKQSKLQEMI